MGIKNCVNPANPLGYSWAGTQTWPGNSYVTSFNGGTWINLTNSGTSGIGSGGPGVDAWMAHASSSSEWFNNSLSNDICYRNTVGRLLLGTNSVLASFIIDPYSISVALPSTKAASVNSAASVGNITATAAQMIAGYLVDSETQTAAFTVTTDTAANILAALPSIQLGSTFVFRFINNDQSATGYAATLAAGTGVTFGTALPNPSIPKGGYADFLVTCSDNTSGSAAFTVTPIGGSTSGIL